MDICYVLNGHACARYISSYLTKNFRALSLTLKEYFRDVTYNNQSPNSILSSTMTKLITASQVGIQEAICFLGNKQLSVKSRTVTTIFTPTLSSVSGFQPSFTLSTFLTSENEIENELLTNIEIATPQIISLHVRHYLERPTSLENICLFRYHQLYYFDIRG